MVLAFYDQDMGRCSEVDGYVITRSLLIRYFVLEFLTSRERS